MEFKIFSGPTEFCPLDYLDCHSDTLPISDDQIHYNEAPNQGTNESYSADTSVRITLISQCDTSLSAPKEEESRQIVSLGKNTQNIFTACFIKTGLDCLKI